MRTLVIEPNPVDRKIIELTLSHEGFAAYFTDFQDAASILRGEDEYDILYVAENLPGMTGFEAVTRLRKEGCTVPIMLMLSTDTAATRTKAFDLGADDCIIKPFIAAEFIARTRAVVRRHNGHADAAIQIGNVSLDMRNKLVSVLGENVPLTGREYQMMEILALKKGTTISKSHFLDHMYGGMDEPEAKIVDVFICKLRKKLADAGAPNVINTVWGRGYTIPVVGKNVDAGIATLLSETGA